MLLEKTLRVPWTAKSNQSILKETNPKYSLKGLMLRLKLQYVDHLMQRADSLEKTLMLGKIEGRRRRGWQRTRGLAGIADSMDMGLNKLWEVMKNREAGRAVVQGWQRVRYDWTPELNSFLSSLWPQKDETWENVFLNSNGKNSATDICKESMTS